MDPTKRIGEGVVRPVKQSRTACEQSKAQAGTSWHEVEMARKYDPSREPQPDADGRHAGDLDGRGGPAPIADGGGLRRDVESPARYCDRVGCNIPVLARKSGRQRRWRRIQARDKSIAGRGCDHHQTSGASVKMDNRDGRWENKVQLRLVLQ